MLRLFALGELRLETETGVVLSRRRKPLVLLVYLARRAPRPASRVELSALLWGERPDAKARQSLRQALLELHRLVGERLQVTHEAVWLVNGDVELDVARFEEDVEAGRERAAVARWTGGFCEGAEDAGETAFRAWADAEDAGLRRRLAVAFERLLDDAGRRADGREAIALARRWTELAPFDEQACLHLITALRRDGHSVEALARHSTFVTRLREELGAAPSRAFRQLAPSLDESARTPPARRAWTAPVRTDASADRHPLVGRADQLALLTSVFDAVRGGAAASVVLHAARGAGATRLCMELAGWAVTAAPATLVLGTADTSSPAAPLSFARAALFRLQEAPALGGLTPQTLATLRHVLPALGDRFQHLEAASAAEPAAERLAAAIRDALDAASEDAPVLWIVDRFDEGDPESRALLGRLSREPQGRVMLLVVDSPRATDGAQSARESVPLRPSASLSIGPLDAHEVDELLQHAGELRPDHRRRLAEALHADTGGLPAYLVPVLDWLVEEGVLGRTSGRHRALGLRQDRPLPVPERVRELAHARRDRRTAHEQRLLDAVAVFAAPVGRDAAERLSGLSHAELGEAADRLVAAELLQARADGQLEIVPPIAARAFYELVPPLRREAMHAASATLVTRDRLWRPRSGAQARIAHHQLQSHGLARRRVPPWWMLAGTALVLIAMLGVRYWPRAAPAKNPTVAILPFSVGGDASLRFLEAGMVDLLSTSLDGASGLRTIDPRAVIAAAGGAPGNAGAPAMGLEQARAVAARLGASHFVLGSVLGAGGRIEISAALYRTDGTVAPDTRASAAGQADGLFSIVDRLTAQLAVAHGAPGGERLAQLAAVTTPSIEALKAYLEGRSAYRANDLYAALPAFQRAVAADSSFALAWYGLASAASWMLRPALEQHASAQAVRFSSRLSARDRMLLQGFAAYSLGVADSAEAMATTLAETYDDIEAWALLGEVLYHHNFKRGRSATESRRAWERVLALDPRYWPALEHLAEVAALEGKRREADSLLFRYERSVGADHMMLASRAFRAYAYGDAAARAAIAPRLAADRGFWLILSVWYVAVFGRDLDDAQGLARMLVDPLRPPEQQGFGRVLLAHLSLARGRWREARAELAIARAHDPADAMEHQLLLSLSPVLASAAGDLDAQRTELDRLPPSTAGAPSSMPWPRPPNSLHPVIRAYLAGMSAARTGDEPARARALSLLDSLPDTAASSGLTRGFAHSIRAERERALGRPHAALAALEQGARETPFVAAWTSGVVSQAYERYLRAELLHELGRDDEALRWYGSFAENSPYDLVYLAPSLRRQAQIHQARGERALAVERYTRFLELWRDCDPELRPLTRQAEAQLALLR